MVLEISINRQKYNREIIIYVCVCAFIHAHAEISKHYEHKYYKLMTINMKLLVRVTAK